jgi:hypothetical protein
MDSGTLFTSSKQHSIPGSFVTHFSNEKKLVEDFTTHLSENIHAECHGIIKEFVCGDGIADIVLFEFNKNWQYSISLGLIQPRWAFALYKLPFRKYFSTDDFIQRTGSSYSRATIVLHQYKKIGFCEYNSERKEWIKLKQAKPVVNKIFAIEAKLRDWKRALSQAYRYRDYAHESWVLLDERSVKPAIQNINHFERLLIGLASISPTGKITAHYTPRLMHPKSDIRFWQANSEIARNMKFMVSSTSDKNSL